MVAYCVQGCYNHINVEFMMLWGLCLFIDKKSKVYLLTLSVFQYTN